MSKSTAIILILLMIIFLVVISPLAAIWSVNILFGTNIAYGIYEWLAALVLIGIVQSNRSWRTNSN